MDLLHLKGNTYILAGPTNVGVYIEKDECWIIDTPDERRTRDLINYLESQGYEVKGVFLTHFHVDHTRGCARLQKMTGVPVYAPVGELSMVAFPVLEGYMLYGAYPLKDLRKGFFEAKPCSPQPLYSAPEIFQVIKLPGHTLDHTGYKTPDGVFFGGDTYFGSSILEKYRYPYLTDFSRSLESLDRLKKTEAEIFVPSHGEPTDNPERDINSQKKAMEMAVDNVLAVIDEPKTLEEILANLDYVDPSSGIGMWFLARSFVAAVLSFLSDKNEISPVIRDGKIFWSKS